MQNISIIGIQKDYTPISNAFKIDIINKEFKFNFNIIQIINVVINIKSSFVESFKAMGENYNNILININTKIDYICEDKTVKYQIFEENTIICVCSNNFSLNKNTSIYTAILDAGIFNISLNTIHIYILYCCSLEI